MLTDQELLNRIVEGDEQALNTLYQAYFQRLSRFLLRMVGGPGLVIEVINDVFLVVWKKAGAFRGESSVSSWIIGIAYRKALKGVKRLKPWTSLEDVAMPLVAQEESSAPSVELASSLARLSPEHRAVMELTYFFGYSYREIGEILRCPENTVKSRMFYARRLLHTILEV